MRFFLCLFAFVIFSNNLSAQDLESLQNYSGKDYFEVHSGFYHFILDLRDNKVAVKDTGRSETLFDLRNFSVIDDGIQYRACFSMDKPDLHVRRMGIYMTELHLENVVFADESLNWAGLGEISICCFRDKIFVTLDGICNNATWIVRDNGRYVYEARAGFRNCMTLSPSEMFFDLDFEDSFNFRQNDDPHKPVFDFYSCVAVMPTVPAEKTAISFSDHRIQVSQIFDQPWTAGEIQETGAAIVFGRDSVSLVRKIHQMQYPLDKGHFSFEWGKYLEYFERAGLYRFLNRGPGTPDPPAGKVGGSKFSIQNDTMARRMMIDCRDTWGGIAGGILTDKEDKPQPVRIQFDLNYPEKADYGEKGGSHAVFPLDLGPEDTLSRNYYALFNQLTHRDLIFLNSLEPGGTGNAGIFQVSINRWESHSTRQEPFKITDFRPHPNDLEGSSASASAISYLTYVNQSGEKIPLKSKAYKIIESGPGLIEYWLEMASMDGKVEGSAHVFQCATSDYNRVFSEVNLSFQETVQLSDAAPIPINFVRYDVGRPMVFRKYAYRDTNGKTEKGALTNAGTGTVHVNGAGLSNPFFFSMYHAPNTGGTQPGLTMSDRSGNPAMVVYDWEAKVNGNALNPAAYAFGSGAVNDYKRFITVVPLAEYNSIQAGSTIRFKIMQITGGDEYTGETFVEDEFQYWPELHAESTSGEIISQFPIHVKAENNRFDITIIKGFNRIPVKASGFSSLEGLWAYVATNGELVPAYGGEQTDAWYNTWVAQDSTYGVTFLINKADSEVPARVKAITTEPDDDFFELTAIRSHEAEKQMTFYPNPASRWLTIKKNNALPSVLYIYDMSGALLKQVKLDDRVNQIALGLPPGTYFIKDLSEGTNEITVGKLIVRN